MLRGRPDSHDQRGGGGVGVAGNVRGYEIPFKKIVFVVSLLNSILLLMINNYFYYTSPGLIGIIKSLTYHKINLGFVKKRY